MTSSILLIADSQELVSKKEGLTVATWSTLSADVNLIEYTWVVLVLAEGTTEAIRNNASNVGSVFSTDVTRDRAARSGTSFVFVGDLRIRRDNSYPLLDYVGLEAKWHNKPISNIKWIKESPLEMLSQSVRSSPYSLESLLDRQMKLSANVTSSAESVAGEAVVFSVALLNLCAHFVPSQQQELATVVPAVLSFCGFEFKSKPPDWVEHVAIHGQDVIDSDIQTLRSEIAEKSAQRATLEQELKDMRWPIGLLYAGGTELENVVCKAFEFLGYAVQQQKGDRVDAIVALEHDEKLVQEELVLEIKSTDKEVIAEYCVRQAATWRVERVSGEREVAVYAIAVVNSQRMVAPDKRTDPFVHNFKVAAKKQNVCVVHTVALFQQVQQKLKGYFDKERFWKVLTSAPGVVDSSEFLVFNLNSEAVTHGSALNE